MGWQRMCVSSSVSDRQPLERHRLRGDPMPGWLSPGGLELRAYHVPGRTTLQQQRLRADRLRLRREPDRQYLHALDPVCRTGSRADQSSRLWSGLGQDHNGRGAERSVEVVPKPHFGWKLQDHSFRRPVSCAVLDADRHWLGRGETQHEGCSQGCRRRELHKRQQATEVCARRSLVQQRLTSQLRGSRHLAASSYANFGCKKRQQLVDPACLSIRSPRYELAAPLGWLEQ